MIVKIETTTGDAYISVRTKEDYQSLVDSIWNERESRLSFYAPLDKERFGHAVLERGDEYFYVTTNNLLWKEHTTFLCDNEETLVVCLRRLF